jgi:hypothetical protein
VVASSGVRPITRIRPHGASPRTTGEKNRCRLVSSVVEPIPVASKTSAFGRSSLDATPSAATVKLTPASRRNAWIALVVSVSAAAPTMAGPSTTGAPSVQRSSGCGSGRPRFLTSNRPTPVRVKFW